MWSERSDFRSRLEFKKNKKGKEERIEDGSLVIINVLQYEGNKVSHSIGLTEGRRGKERLWEIEIERRGEREKER